MPEHTKAVLETFIALARDSTSVTATLDPRGVLTFCSAEASRSVLVMHAVNETKERPQLLN